MNHAFLIMAHTNYPLLSRLLKKLDHKDNTIYIHIDAKSQFSIEDEEMLKKSCQLSKIHFVKRYSVTWGGYSQINCELRLLEAAVKHKHDYYHFISGVDFPTKSMSDIHTFFENYKGCEFVHFSSEEFVKNQSHRYKRYHFFREKFGRNYKSPLYYLEKVSLFVQRKIFKTDRSKKYPEIVFKGGANWCSITHKFVEYLLSKENQIEKMFSKSFCCDEFFLQTIIYNSPFKENIYCIKYDISPNEACLRSVDWERPGNDVGSPYTFTVEDYENLVNSPNLFCRKITDKTEQGNALIRKLELL